MAILQAGRARLALRSRSFLAQAARSCAGKVTPEDLDARTAGKTGLWGSFVKWSYKWLGDSVYPVKADICNCGADLGVRIPKPELIRREGVEPGSREYKMQLYGAALYYHMATMTTEVTKKAQPDMLRDKDVLEVACMRGGGARYLAEVVGPRRYLGTDNLQEHIDRCRRDHGEWPGLEFQVTDAHHLAETCYSLFSDSPDTLRCDRLAQVLGSTLSCSCSSESLGSKTPSSLPGMMTSPSRTFSRLPSGGSLTGLHVRQRVKNTVKRIAGTPVSADGPSPVSQISASELEKKFLKKA